MTNSQVPRRAAQSDPAWVRWSLIALAVAIMSFLVVVPLVNVFATAFYKGFAGYWEALTESGTFAALRLTFIAAPAAVLINTIFGLAAAWAITRFDFPLKAWLTTVIDLPLAISPVVAGLMIMLLFGRNGWFGPALEANDIQVVFAWPGIILATTFVTLPFVARELIPVMQAVGREEEMAAVTLGANSWQLFWRVVLPNIKWGLLYGVILCNARAMGEYGAVAMIAGNRASNYTLPLRVEYLWQNNPGVPHDAFAVASILSLLALITLGAKSWLERAVARNSEQ
jgi:sulfate transport system permease protein